MKTQVSFWKRLVAYFQCYETGKPIPELKAEPSKFIPEKTPDPEFSDEIKALLKDFELHPELWSVSKIFGGGSYIYREGGLEIRIGLGVYGYYYASWISPHIDNRTIYWYEAGALHEICSILQKEKDLKEAESFQIKLANILNNTTKVINDNEKNTTD